MMEREVIRVEPLSSYLEKWKAPTSVVTRYGDAIYVSGLPPFDPDTGEIKKVSLERQPEIVLDQMKLCLETAGSLLEHVLKCNVYCTSGLTNVVPMSDSASMRRKWYDRAP